MLVWIDWLDLCCAPFQPNDTCLRQKGRENDQTGHYEGEGSKFKGAKILREQYHATRVAVFGSLLHEARFNQWSDIDIAAWGIPPDQTFRAIGAVLDLDTSFEINLVDVNTCRPALLKVIEQEAVDL